MVEICFIISELFKLDLSIYLTTTARLDRPLLETVPTIKRFMFSFKIDRTTKC